MYISSEVADTIKHIAKSNEISMKEVLDKAGLGFNTMANMKTSMPKADNLAKIADVLNCSVDYLLGRTDNPNSHLSALLKSTKSDPQVDEFLCKFTKLSKEKQNTLLMLIDELSKS